VENSRLVAGYPRFVTPEFEPFDPVELLRWTEEIVCRGDARKYTAFYATGVYGGIGTGYAVGCCLRCVFCWVEFSRDFPELYGKFYSAEEAARRIVAAARHYGTPRARISGGEPTLGKEHLLSVLQHIEREPRIRLFILETNGIPLAIDPDYVHALEEFTKIHVRVSLKAGTPEAFSKKTGARPEAFELPFKAISHLLQHRISFHVAAMSLDPRFMSPEERTALMKRLASLDFRLLLNLEEEVVDPYDTTLKRLAAANWRVKWPLRRVYTPISETLRELLRQRRQRS